MLENCVSVKERWGGVDRMVRQLLAERQQLLVQYCEACTVENAGTGRSPERINQLCGILVDYVSAGHFEVYEHLLREADAFDEDGFSQLAKHYPAIERSTEIALAFNDKYSEANEYRSLQRDLSQLGEALESRFEAEDQLINSLHMSHKQKVA